MRTLLAAAVTALLFVSCGESHEGRARANVVQDTLRYTDDLTTAEDLLRRGEGVEAAIIARKVYQASLVDPTLYKQRVRAVSILGRILQRSAELDSALICYREGLRYAELAGDKAGMGSMWLNIGVALEIKGQYVEALSAELTSLRLKELDSDSLALAHVLHNLSVLYWRQDSIDQAIRMLQRSIAIKRISDSLRLASGLNGLGVLLIEAQQYDSAIAVLRESLVLDHKHSAGAQRDMVLVNMGLAFEGAGSLDSAAHYYEASRTAAKEEGHQDLELRALYSLGDIARKRGRYEEARVHLDSSLAIAIRIGSMEDRKEARGSLVLLYEAMGDYKAAFENQNLYQALSDSLMNEGTEMGMQELRLQYDTEKKDRENNELRITQELAELRAARNRWIAIGIGVLAVAIAVFAWAIVQRNRHRSRERVAELEQQTMRLQMDPHFLFNALNAIRACMPMVLRCWRTIMWPIFRASFGWCWRQVVVARSHFPKRSNWLNATCASVRIEDQVRSRGR
ncbi:MAG: tetratricopeptide repeat protein [Flavobacteriales bacterium]|nr:tetratricopeptide repeat protein [Flavobacteriales bacterium]